MKPITFLQRSCVLGAIATIAIGASGTTPNATQYDVNRIDARMTRYASRPGEIILKFKTEGSSTRLKAVNGKVKTTGTASALNTLLDKYGANDTEELMPLTGAQVTPAARRAKAFNGDAVADNNLSALYVVRLDASKAANIDGVAKEFASLAEVEYAEPNYLVYACADASTYTTDPLYSQQWGPAAIGLDKLWDVTPISTKRPVIAILDTGVDITHPDLADNIWTNSAESDGAEGRDDDNNGFADDIHGWDFVNQSPRMRDNNGHGTHCAGIAAAVGGNGVGITGANPDALIMPLTVMQSNGQGDMATIIKGIDYATANGADVISMSFGSYSESMALAEALGKAYQKAVLVAAAGNEQMCIYPHTCPINRVKGSPMFPAAYSFVLGVEASADAEGNRASFSNFDDDGPITSKFSGLYNYELRAPGTGIMSTFPGGQYRALNGTSMACPLVAGAISRLMSVKEIRSKEELFGDLIHTASGNMNIYNAYAISDADRKPTLSLITYRIDDSEDGDGDGRADAGETISIYPTFRNDWGIAQNITYSLRLSEMEDPEIVTLLDSDGIAMTSHLSSYASAEAETPLRFKINPDCVDGRIICLELRAIYDNASKSVVQEIQLSVENGIELNGVLKEDMTLTPDKNYIINENFVVPDDRTLTIESGTTIKLKDGVGFNASNGHVIANGEPGKMITFKPADLSLGNITQIAFNQYDNINYCHIEGFWISGLSNLRGTFNNSIIKHITSFYLNTDKNKFTKCNITSNKVQGISTNDPDGFNYSNVINNIDSDNYPEYITNISLHSQNNIFNNLDEYKILEYGAYSAIAYSENGAIIPSNGNYLGSAKDEILRKTVLDIHTPDIQNFGEFDLSTKVTRPVHDAHGIVWKVVVNGYDAQDEFEWLSPLGVGTHKFEVWFSREMNHEKTPHIAMGVRAPYTQTAIAENGSWRSETMENGDVVDVYTAYLTIQGRDSFDGINTIYVADAEDDEFFPIPIENVRFHVNVQSAGSMSSGFTAEPGVGKVTLTWENPEENFDDMLGYNMYRYTLGENDEPSDTIRINERLLDTEELVDYDIVPGTTYCYFYKVLRTSLSENSPSKVVAATPRAAGKGDCNGSGDVDVADVVTEVNYMVGRDPKPFIFEAADVNTDTEVDILDVVGTVNIILKPAEDMNVAAVSSTATYYVENGILYVESPVEIAGVQAELKGERNETQVSVLDALKGMENTGEWVSETGYRFLSFSLSGKTLTTGKHAILSIEDGDVDNLILVDGMGRRIMAMRVGTTGISSVVMQQMLAPTPNPFHDVLNVPVVIGTEGTHEVELRLVNLAGSVALSQKRRLDYGEHTITLDGSGLQSGFYLLTMSVDGETVQTSKVIKK